MPNILNNIYQMLEEIVSLKKELNNLCITNIKEYDTLIINTINKAYLNTYQDETFLETIYNYNKLDEIIEKENKNRESIKKLVTEINKKIKEIYKYRYNILEKNNGSIDNHLNNLILKEIESIILHIKFVVNYYLNIMENIIYILKTIVELNKEKSIDYKQFKIKIKCAINNLHFIISKSNKDKQITDFDISIICAYKVILYYILLDLRIPGEIKSDININDFEELLPYRVREELESKNSRTKIKDIKK